MGAPTKRARKIRKAAEFDVAGFLRAMSLQPPPTAIGAYAWNLVDIVNARNAQMTGRFKMAARLAESMRTDDAIHVARSNRLAPLRSIKVKIVPAKGAGAGKIANEAEALFGQSGVGINPDTIRDIHDCLVVHSVAFGLAVPTMREDGSRVDYSLRYWPIEFVRWDPYEKVFKTQVDGGFEETICHGDGRWIIFQEGEFEPFKNGALLAAAMVWARHAFAARDWSKSSVAHGTAKVIGEMPANVPLQKTVTNGDGSTSSAPSDEASAMMILLQAIASSDAAVGLRPAGSKTDFLTNLSTAWQVFSELVLNAEKAAARIFQGTDALLGSQGGAPGVDITKLFGVATTKVLGDIACIERALQTGLIEIWAAVNFGSSALAPTRKYQVPDPDADALKASFATRQAAFSAAIKGRKDAGVELTQDDVDGLAADFQVRSFTVVQAPTAPTATAPADVTAHLVALTRTLTAGTPSVPGPPGPPGKDGTPGARGETGAAGKDGRDGAQGPQGDAGAAGKDGREGAPGARGETGATGRDGVPGARGDTGPAGKDGRDGVDGAPGAKGDAGADGKPTMLSFAERSAAFQADLKDYRANGLCIDQREIEQLAKLHGVPTPRLKGTNP